jgi:hypothetical protein
MHRTINPIRFCLHDLRYLGLRCLLGSGSGGGGLGGLLGLGCGIGGRLCGRLGLGRSPESLKLVSLRYFQSGRDIDIPGCPVEAA